MDLYQRRQCVDQIRKHSQYTEPLCHDEIFYICISKHLKENLVQLKENLSNVVEKNHVAEIVYCHQDDMVSRVTDLELILDAKSVILNLSLIGQQANWKRGIASFDHSLFLQTNLGYRLYDAYDTDVSRLWTIDTDSEKKCFTDPTYETTKKLDEIIIVSSQVAILGHDRQRRFEPLHDSERSSVDVISLFVDPYPSFEQPLDCHLKDDDHLLEVVSKIFQDDIPCHNDRQVEYSVSTAQQLSKQFAATFEYIHRHHYTHVIIPILDHETFGHTTHQWSLLRPIIEQQNLRKQGVSSNQHFSNDQHSNSCS